MCKKIDTISTTINFLKQPKDFCFEYEWFESGHTCTQTDQQTATPSQWRLQRCRRWWRSLFEEVQWVVWLQPQSEREVGVSRDGLRRRGRGSSDRADLRTSFNSTLLWKLQLPLSRLVPRSHPCASALFATQTTPAGLHPGGIKVSLRVGFMFLRHNPNQVTHVWVCVYMCVRSAKSYMQKKKVP